MKKIVILFLFAVLSFQLSAQVVSSNEARQAAISFFLATDKAPQKLKSEARIKSSSPVNVDSVTTYFVPRSKQNKLAVKSEVQAPAFYIFNRTDKPGFVMVSGDKRIREIIAYSTSSNFCGTNPGLDGLLNQYVQEITYAKENNLNANTITYDYSSASDGEWLLGKIEWDQGPDPYNSNCPYDANSVYTTNKRVPAGCVATAMAQIIYYYKYPRFGKGSHIWNSRYASHYVDFANTEYKYELMIIQPLPGLSIPQISQLLYHCGVAVDMEYDSKVSGSNDINAKNALETYFNYKKCNIKTLMPFSWDSWKELIKNEIDNKRPIYYSAIDFPLNGHAFILDGYKSDDTYHINWGWGGCSNDFYPLSLLKPTVCNNDMNFNLLHQMIIGIEPAYPDITPPHATYIDCTTHVNTNIVVTFNEPIKESTLSESTIIVKGEKSGNHEITYDYDIENYKLTVTPNTAFLPNEKVTFTLRQNLTGTMSLAYLNGITDLVGNYLDGDWDGNPGPDYIYEFTTEGLTHDYGVESVSVSNKNPGIGDIVTVSAVIGNEGLVDEPANQQISLYDNGALVKSVSTFPALSVGQKKTYSFNWTAKSGSHELKVVIALTGDENTTNDYKTIKTYTNTIGDVQANEAIEQTYDISAYAGKTSLFTFYMQNNDTVNFKAGLTISGTKSSWLSLYSDSIFVAPHNKVTYMFNVTVPSGTTEGIYNTTITFTNRDGDVTNIVNLRIQVLEAPNGISGYEYWFDDLYSQKKSKSFTAQNNYTLDDLFPVSGIETGLHSFQIRFFDNNDNWSSVTSEFFHKLPNLSNGEKYITLWEYWFDDDYSNRVTSMVNSGGVVSLKRQLDVGSLVNGLHCYHVRYKDDAGQWSSIVSEFFQKIPLSETSTRNITACEYWIDEDYANKVSSEVTPGQTISISGGFVADSISTGLHNYHVRYKDDAGQWSSVVSEFFHKLPTTSTGLRKVTNWEYWFDDNYTTKVTTAVSPDQLISVNSGFEVGSLSSGLHSYHVRYKDDAGQWSSIVSEFFQKIPVATSGTRNITATEYWMDEDYANKVSSVVTPGQTILVNGGFNAESLSTGLHSYYVRFKDDAGQWSSVVSEFFHKLPTTSIGLRKVTNWEYWFDDNFDTKVSASVSPDQMISVNSGFEVGSLSSGLHSYHVRYKDDAGQWSSIVSEFFQKIPVATSGTRNITASEYWIDEDYANKVSSEVTPGQTILVNGGFNVESLSTGLHSYYVRFKDDAGQWSSVVSEFFHKLPTTTSGIRKITDWEYWFDDNFDTKVSASVSPDQLISVNSGFEVGSLTNGLHCYHVRYKDDAGQWSSIVSEFFQKINTTGGQANVITAYRYWFDRNEKDIITVNVENTQNPYLLIRDLNIYNLSVGTHTIHTQFKDLRQEWSSATNSSLTKTNTPPIANAGSDQTVYAGTLVILDGSASSDPDGSALTYKWTAPTGITLSSTTVVQPTFTAPNVTTDTNYAFSLVVNDGTINSSADEVVITVKPANKTLNITAMFESLYNGGGTMRQAQNALGAQWPTGVADHITVELHSSTKYATIVYSAADVPISITGAATVMIPAIFNGSYYITIKHRNSIETTSASAVSFAENTIIQSYLSPTSVYGGNLVRMIDLHYAIYGGDVNHDGIIDSGDMTPVENSAALAKTGYLFEDCNGDGLIDSSDMTIIENNAGLAIGASTP